MPNIPESWLGRRQVNITTAGAQTEPDIVQLANGNILVTWTSAATTGAANPAGTDIIGQIYDPLGNRIGGEFRLNGNFVADDEQHASAAALPGGGFVVAYWSRVINGPGNAAAIALQEYDANGVALGNPATVASNPTGADPDFRNPVVAVSSATSAMVVYESVESAGLNSVSKLMARLFNPATDAYSAPIEVLAAGSGSVIDGDIAVLANGNYVIAGRQTGAGVGGGDSAILYRIVSPQGTNVANAQFVTGTNTNGFDDRDPSITALTNGNFVISWTNTDSGDQDVLWTLYNAGGAQIGFGGVASGASNNGNGGSAVQALEDGTFVVVYANTIAGTVAVERFNATGSSLGTFTIAAAAGSQISATSLEDGRFAVTWLATGGELQMDILDTRDVINAPAYTTRWQVGRVGGDDVDVAPGARVVHGHTSHDNIFVPQSATVRQIFGDIGDDTIGGAGSGDDLFVGGVGNDWYINPGSNHIVEEASQGFDRVISDASYSLVTLPNVERLELTGAVPGFLRGNNSANSLIGNSGSNMIEGLAGNDTILGLGGRDTITGGLGRDTIAPGLERDTVKWNAVAESTGAGRDSVSEFVFSSGGPYERLDFHVMPTAVRTTIATGSLSEASFDTDLALAVNAARLGAGQAVLFDPNGGDLNLAGHIYLVVDANGVAGYQANQDYVVQFSSWYGTLTLANFI